jgi:hypothetical protein
MLIFGMTLEKLMRSQYLFQYILCKILGNVNRMYGIPF